MKLTAEQRLKAISKLVESATGFDADCYCLKEKKNKEAEEFAKLIMKIYRVVHPHFGCKHDDWDEETLKLYEN